MKKIIPFLIFCSIATCNAELRTWTAVNGKEVEAEFVSNEKGIVKLKLKSGKVFEVPENKLSKEDNNFLIDLIKRNAVPLFDENLEERDGLLYLKKLDLPYTGKVYALYPSGKLESVLTYKEGLANGLHIFWYESGIKKQESMMKQTGDEYIAHGLHLAWHENGQMVQRVNFNEGKRHGSATYWHESGVMNRKLNFRNGKFHGLNTFWHENGQMAKQEVCKDGELIEGTQKLYNKKGKEVKTLEEVFQ